ncbi:MAG: MmgE/PrpD family protein [Alphaproteobacteria bacterium]
MSIAERYEPSSHESYPVTAEAAKWVADLRAEDITDAAFERAKHVLLDWLGCSIAGSREPLVGILLEELGGETQGPCTLLASGQRARLHDAALINGAMAHALDYDDVNRRLHGHPTACIAPAVMALGELMSANGKDLLTSFIAGTEIACSLGAMCEEGHYEVGFHATGTLGTFGAAAAAARLMQLDADTTALALGIAASQAAGLKANFGTMTKPLHAGKAAMNGLLAARLAARGFTASETAIEGAHGFAQAQVPGFEPGPIRPEAQAPYAVEQMLYKFHASCFLTHSTLNAIRALRAEHGFGLDDVEAATLKVRSTHASVCCIPEPVSGLEIKFSIVHLAAMGLDGADTSALEIFSDENANDPRYTQARGRIRLDLSEDMDRSEAVVTVKLKDGRELRGEDNVGVPATDTNEQWERLSAKFSSLSTPVAGAERTAELLQRIGTLEKEADISTLMKTAG